MTTPTKDPRPRAGRAKHPLQEALDRIGLSQKRLAKLAGISQSVVCATINGTGGRVKFSSEAAGRMLPHLVDPKTGQPLISLADLIYPPGEVPAAARGCPARRRSRR